jgi:hypothetical protein
MTPSCLGRGPALDQHPVAGDHAAGALGAGGAVNQHRLPAGQARVDGGDRKRVVVDVAGAVALQRQDPALDPQVLAGLTLDGVEGPVLVATGLHVDQAHDEVDAVVDKRPLDEGGVKLAAAVEAPLDHGPPPLGDEAVLDLLPQPDPAADDDEEPHHQPRPARLQNPPFRITSRLSGKGKLAKTPVGASSHMPSEG